MHIYENVYGHTISVSDETYSTHLQHMAMPLQDFEVENFTRIVLMNCQSNISDEDLSALISQKIVEEALQYTLFPADVFVKKAER